MANPSESSAARRPGNASPILVALLAGILLALVVLIAVLATRGGEGSTPGGPAGERSASGVADGRTVRRVELADPPPAPKPVGDPDRIKQTLQAGRTYRVVIKAGLDARVEDKSWAVRKVVAMAYAAEMAVDRAIESNDGRRVVELRRFVTSRNAKILCDVEDVSVELGPRGTLLLGALDLVLPGTTEAVAVATPIAEAILGRGARAAAYARANKAVGHVDSISGKAVRIAYLDGVGVESITPVGCSLTEEERAFVFASALLSDCYLLPNLKVAVGGTWAVDGAQLAGFLDPSLRGRPSGRVVVAREADGVEGGRPYATLAIREGTLEVDSSDASARRIGRFSPSGTMRFRLDQGFVDRADLAGRFAVEEVSTDHILFETSFKTRPTLRVEYSCEMLPAEAPPSPR